MRTTRRAPNSRKRAATNVVLFVGLAALALVAWYDVNGKLPTRRQASQQYTIDALNFVREDGKTFAFARDKSGWRMLQPVRVEAQPSRVEKLVALIDSNTDDGYHISDVNLEATGLASPRIRMRLGEATAVFFGDTEPLTGRRYIQIEDRVILLDDQHVPLMEGGVNAFASRSLLATPVDSVEFDGAKLNAEAWETVSALGIRQIGESIPVNAQPIAVVTDGETQAWHSWPDDALIALYREGDDIHYLISQADAATLGISP